MKITVTTIHTGIHPDLVKPWTDKVFDGSWAPAFYKADQIENMKARFLDGEKIEVATSNPKGHGFVRTSFKLEEE